MHQANDPQTGRVYERPESKFLWIEYRDLSGKKVRRSARTACPKVAQQKLQEALKEREAIPFREAVVDFFDVKSRPGQLAPATLRHYRGSLRAVDPILGHLTLDAINADVLKDLVRARRATVSDTAVRRDLAFVSSVITHAMETMPKAPEHNAVISFSKKHLKENARVRWLRRTEYERLLKACSNEVQELIIKTAVHTGMRHSELCALRASMIDFDRGEITLPADVTKNDRERVIPLCAWLCHELQELCLEDLDLVFYYTRMARRRPVPYTSFNGFWRNVKTRAGLKDLRIHDLRHTFASWWVQGGGGLMELRDVLGHSSLQMVQRYAHLNTGARHEQIRKVFGHRLDTVKDKP